MTLEAIAHKLRTLDSSCSGDRDGGYNCVTVIRKWIDTLDEADKNVTYAFLVKLVDMQKTSLWGVALEVLVQERSVSAAQMLGKLLSERQRTQEWMDFVIMALIRLRYKESAEFCSAYISKSLASGRLEALPLLAALCLVDKEMCLNAAAIYFGMALTSDPRTNEHRNYIAPFISQFLREDEQMLAKLVQRTKNVSETSSLRLKNLVEEELLLPWNRRANGAAIDPDAGR